MRSIPTCRPALAVVLVVVWLIMAVQVEAEEPRMTAEAYVGWFSPDSVAVDAGPSAGVRVGYHVHRSFTLQLGVGRFREVGFERQRDERLASTAQSAAPNHVSLTFIDVAAVWFPVGSTGRRVSPYLYAGLGGRLADDDLGLVEDELDVEAGAGLDLNLGVGLFVRPDVKVRSVGWSNRGGFHTEFEGSLALGLRF